MKPPPTSYEIIDFSELPGTHCPCGTARRALMDVDSVPYSFHLTEISTSAKTHYHKAITETYFILECNADACLELDGKPLPLKRHSAIVIHPGTRHRAIGNMKVIIVASPKFDPADEWFD